MFFIANYILLQRDIQTFAEYAVALHVSAWIETDGTLCTPIVHYVALHVSAWIETVNLSQRVKDEMSRTPCECVD